MTAEVVAAGEWIGPTPVTGSAGAPLSPAQIESWRSEGAVVVEGLVPIDLVMAARAEAITGLARPDDDSADFGSDGQYVFPSECESLNSVTLHPQLLTAVAQLLGCAVRDLRLTQSDLWAKHGRGRPVTNPFDNTDQRMHVDYPNHTLAHPPEWDSPDAVEMIIYADDVDECDGATAVVLRSGADDPAYRWPIVDTPGVGDYRWVNDRTRAERYLEQVAPDVAQWRREQLYARERRVRYRPGTVLLYRHDTWHRGTPIRAGATRVVINLTFRRAASDWINTLHIGWSWAAYRPSRVIERLVAAATVDQRCVLGFPPPGHPYWTPATLDAVEARYGTLGIDLSEYRAALT
jgi:ectoine hydroxylase-related dioxygenase (phytanoyl-CoA dioxygenase family)